MNQTAPQIRYDMPAHSASRTSMSPGISEQTSAPNMARNSGGTCMPQDNAQDAVPAIRSAYELAQEGRKSAALAGSRLESLIFRRPQDRQFLATAAVEYLSGADLTAGADNAQAAGQAVLARLNLAIDGIAARITKIVLEPEAVARLRVFRQQVRELVTTTSRANAPAAGR